MTEITATSKLCLVIGDPVGHSLSPKLHNAAYQACGISDKFVYAAARVTPEALPQAIAGIRALGVRGVSVTIPHKTAVIPLLDEVDPLAAKIGAVNTIVNNDGVLKGYNSDAIGVVTPLEARLSLAGRRIALIGAGGAARAAAFAVTARGAKLTIFNRTLARATALARECGAEAADLSAIGTLPEFEIILQSSSVGMSPQADASPIPREHLRPSQLIFDFVYNPLETLLLRDAKEVGASTIPGLEMFLQQGTAQFELFTGMRAPLEAMREVMMGHFKIAT